MAQTPIDEPVVRIEHVSKRFGDLLVADDITLSIAPGEVVVFLGPSGGGKTTLLRMIAGLEWPDDGSVEVAGKRVHQSAARDRDIGFVFQNYALFPHMTVFENVAYGLRVRHAAPEELRSRVGEVLKLVRLQGLEGRLPRQLSGGQQQRVSLARALVVRPKLLIMDEPFGALDAQLRKQMQVEFRQIQRAASVTTIMVTHDQEEALTIGDRVAVMRSGRIEQVGTPFEVYEHPRSEFVATFLGEANVLRAEVREESGGVRLRLSGGAELPADGLSPAAGPEVRIAIRPEHLALAAPGSDMGDDGALEGTVRQVVYYGGSVLYSVEIGHDALINVRLHAQALSDSPYRHAPGDRVQVRVPRASVRLLEN